METTQEKVKDGYDLQIEFLKANPEMIHSEWLQAKGLFTFISPTYSASYDCGCLTIIKSKKTAVAINNKKEIDSELTEKIKADKRVPLNDIDINLDNLEVFAEYQRLVDERYGRIPFEFYNSPAW